MESATRAGACVKQESRESDRAFLQALFSAAIPATILGGHLAARVEFPKWLGENSRRNKRVRLLQQLHEHMFLSTYGTDTTTLQLYYMSALRRALTTPLVHGGQEGIEKVMTFSTNEM